MYVKVSASIYNFSFYSNKRSLVRVYLHTEVIHEQIHAAGIVLTRLILAHADVFLAMDAGPALWTYALECTDLVPAYRVVQTRIGGAVVYVGLARGAGKAFATVTHESIVEVYAEIGAHRIARIAETLIDLRLAL